MEDRGIKEIEKAAHDYADARDARMAQGEEEQRRHTKLIAVMRKHGKTTYVHRDGGEIIEVKIAAKDATAKAKVKIVPADDYKSTEPAPQVQPEVGGDHEPEPETDLDGDETGEVDDE